MLNLLSTIALFSSFPLIHAQYGNQAKSSTTTAASSTTSTTSAASGIHTVDVGEDGLSFNPSSLTVSPGDKVEFHFFPPDHSVVQASFDNPCQPISSGGFFSGFFQTSQESKTVFTVTVNNTDPIWLYCGVQGHCQAGMVGVINPPSSGDTLDSFKAAAAKAKDSTVPANVFGGVVGAASSSNTSSTATGTSTATSTGSASKTSAAASTTTNAANTMRTAGDVSALALLGLFSWLMM